MKSVLGKVLCRIVQKVGWKLNRVKGSHHIYTQENNSVILVIPVHGNRDLPIGTLKAILKNAGLTEDDLNL
ncbi:MAG: type II toxin-antitoxin system HicA family toxin [Planktothrix sp.]|uniref:type II toxin-antitoxin system HicA family toxin n=1 Tax=Planktothrix sp. TaxID=3088171 RepID=UPI0038D4F5E8